MELFISDLDGTLLNNNKEISIYSKKYLNKLIYRGINFTVATARTPATVIKILEGLDIRLPVILMNGVIIYDIKSKKYINIEEVKETLVEKVLNIFSEYNKNPLVYGIDYRGLLVYYKEFAYEVEYKFYKERCNSPYKTFIKIEDYFKAAKNSKIINFVTYDRLEVVKAIYKKLSKIEGLTVNYYEEIYDRGWYFLEAYSSKASKANGIKFLSKSFSKVTCFGDNINDIPMFKASDECYAVENANELLKNMATAVIGNNNKDGVVNFLKKKFC